MRIRSLAISGFKSFPDRVVLTFPRGICGIVGPNGCGKSNVVDAIRWVMGEQNPRHLRGRTMEDLIFAGSESKAPVGMVEVVLTLDNSDGAAPGDYAGFGEIEISRRLYRGGESEYRINRVPCRLRDITDFFLDTGVGTRGYTIVEQGRIAEIVSTRPQERRIIIEEAAGIGKYRQRRRETERKLEATEQNLVRVTDILGELRRQIGMLERQSRRAHRYRELSSRLRELELSVAAEDLQSQQSDLDAERAELESLREQGRGQDRSVAEAEGRLTEARERRTALEEQLRHRSERLYQLRSTVQALEGRIQYERREREELISLADRGSQEVETLLARVEQQREEEAALRSEQSEIETRLEHEAQDVARGREELDGLSSRVADLRGRRDALARRLLDLSTQAATLESRAEGAADRRGELERQLRAQEERVEASTVTLESTRAEESKIEGALAELLAKRDSIGRDLATLLGRRDERVEERRNLAREMEGLLGSRERARARLEALEEQEAEARRRSAGLLERVGDPDRQRVRARLAEVLRVEPGYESAVEAALGSRLSALVVDGPEDALSLLDRLRSADAGRITLLAVRPAEEERGPGFVPLGRSLLEFVDAKPPYLGVVSRVLGEVYVVDDLREVIDRYGVERLPATFVTAQGDVLDRTGAVTGGTPLLPGEVSRLAEVRTLHSELERLDERHGTLEARHREIVGQEEVLERDIENTRSRYHSSEVAVAQQEKDLERARERRKNAAEAREGLLEAKAALLEGIERVEADLSTVRTRIEEIGGERAAVERDGARSASEIAELERQLDRVERAQVERQVGLASLTERRDQHRTAHERTRVALRDAEEWIGRRRQEVASARERTRAFDSGIAEAEAQLARSLEEEERLRVGQEEARVTFEASSRVVGELEEKQRAGQREREALRERITAAELRAQESRLAAERTAERVRERYGVDLGAYEVPAEHRAVPRDERRTEAGDLARKIDALGPVHQGAIEEYEEVSERFRYLTEQKDDLESSIERLRNAIARINRTSRARFRETFERVDAEFRKIFPRLFRGGRAYLALTEGEDVLEAGIEIVAQPPGKKLQNINLLSGGEKSLTALSLLFAVFNVKPSPFFLLDEVDAALDDVNVGRFDELMREVASTSQFLLITHNKSTIEVADTLYGVTMEEAGASKIVSVELRS